MAYTGEAISTKKGGKSTYDPIAVAPEREVVVEEKLSTGAIIGIAIGASVAGLAVLGCGLFLFRMCARLPSLHPALANPSHASGVLGAQVQRGEEGHANLQGCRRIGPDRRRRGAL